MVVSPSVQQIFHYLMGATSSTTTSNLTEVVTT